MHKRLKTEEEGEQPGPGGAASASAVSSAAASAAAAPPAGGGGAGAAGGGGGAGAGAGAAGARPTAPLMKEEVATPYFAEVADAGGHVGGHWRRPKEMIRRPPGVAPECKT